MIASIILAVSISSSCITNFMTVPPWMPTSVSSADTFGSADHATASHRVTSNTLAAVEALFDAYYERVYFKSAAGGNDRMWNVREYGPRDFAHMSFTNGTTYVDTLFNYRNGNRTVPETRRLIEFPMIVSLSSFLNKMVESDRMMIGRNNWSEFRVEDSWWASSASATQRLPESYGWSGIAPYTSSFVNRCIPIFSYAPDQFFNLYDRGSSFSLYPIPRMYLKADEEYYNRVVQHVLPTMRRSSTFIDLIDSTFGGSAASGMADTSRRLKPDDYFSEYVNETNSSLIATECRVLAMLDRTYDFPHCSTYGSITSTTVSATQTADYFYDGTVSGLSLTFNVGGAGTFTCDEFTDSDLEYSMSICSTNVNTEHSLVQNSTKDRARFGGTLTSISQHNHTFGISGSFDEVRRLFAPVDIDTNYLGVVDVNFVQDSPSGRYIICVKSADIWNYTLSDSIEFDVSQVEGSSFDIQQNVGISRSCTSSWTSRATHADAVNIIPCPMPCGSAFNSGRVLLATASFLGWICRYWHMSPGGVPIGGSVTYGNSDSDIMTIDTFHRISNRTLSDVNSLWYGYVLERNDNFGKVMYLMSEASPNWQNVELLSRVNDGFISGDHAGDRVVINGGTFAFNISIEGYVLGSGQFISEMEDVGGGKMMMKHFGLRYGGMTRWFSDSSTIDYTITFTVDDEGYGYSLSDSAADLNAMSIDSCAIPMVTTDWNWKAIKMSN